MADHTHFDAIGVPRDNREWREISCADAEAILDACTPVMSGGRGNHTHGPVTGYVYYRYMEWSAGGDDLMRTFMAPDTCIHQVPETTTHIDTEEN